MLTGQIMYFAGPAESLPDGYVPLDGRQIPIAGNEELAAMLGNKFGASDGLNVYLPDARGRVVMGKGLIYGTGTKYGQETVSLLPASLPTHTHDLACTTTAAGSSIPNGALLGAGFPMYTNATVPVDSTMARGCIASKGSGAPHSNIQPYMVVTAAILVTGGATPQA